MKRLTNYLFFLDEKGNLKKVIPLTKQAESFESEFFMPALFNELTISNQIIKESLLKYKRENGPSHLSLCLGGNKLTMELNPLTHTDEVNPGTVVTFFEGENRQSPIHRKPNSNQEDSREDINELSHEIKNSVNIIQGISELIKETGHSESKLLIQLDSSVKYLKSLVVNYLIDQKSKKLRWEKSNFDLRLEIEELLEQFAFLNKSKNQQLEYNFDPNIPEVVKGYPVALRQVLINLFFNAMEHSQLGGIKFSVGLIAESEKFVGLNFAVEDSGQGYLTDPKEEADQFQISTFSKKKKGFGLGLKICRKILSSMSSELKIQSVKGEGTRFSFELVFSKVSKTISPEDLRKTDSSTDSGLMEKRALVVDDNQINRMIASKYLDSLGFATEEAPDGVQALQKLNESDYEILILDIHLPHLDGISLLNIIRPRFPKLMVILSSGADHLAEYLSPLDLGKISVLEKPYSQKDLEEILREEFQY